jgi:Tfp pilus assembly protein PilX
LTDRSGEAGFAIVVALMGVLLISAVGTALVLTTSVDTLITRNFRDGTAALYAADAAATHGALELSQAPDWSAVLAGWVRSSFFDGSAAATRTLQDGSTINLTEIVNLANCGTLAGCSDAVLSTTGLTRPWGMNNPRWQLFASGRLAELLGAPSPFYVIVLIADDPSETDGDPSSDGSGTGAGIVLLRAEAFGPGGAHASVEAVAARITWIANGVSSTGVRVVSWRAGP